MPDLDFKVTGVQAAERGLTPLLHFPVRLTAAPEDQAVQAVLLNVQIQLQPPQRAYTAAEKEKLIELFGAPDQWGQTLRNRLWTHATTSVGAFTGSTEATLAVACSYDLNVASAKYFYALEGGEVSLLFLFSGSVFYLSQEGRLQVEPISWSKECVYRMPAQLWHDLMKAHYPDAWLSLSGEGFDRLYGYRRRRGLATWDETIKQLLSLAEKTDGTSVICPAEAPEKEMAA